jgi:hypothetical protein
VSILFEIVVGRPTRCAVSTPPNIPAFVSSVIKSGLCYISDTRYSFHDILEIMKNNNCQIEDGVGSADVWGFVKWVESTEHPQK